MFNTITLPETNISPENGWLEYKPFLLGSRPIFRGELLVSGRVTTFYCTRSLINRDPWPHVSFRKISSQPNEKASEWYPQAPSWPLLLYPQHLADQLFRMAQTLKKLGKWWWTWGVFGPQGTPENVDTLSLNTHDFFRCFNGVETTFWDNQTFLISINYQLTIGCMGMKIKGS